MTRTVEPWMWGVFVVAVGAMLAADLLLIHRHAERVTLRSAALWSAVWIALACAFGAIVYRWLGSAAAAEYFTGYLIEKTLSVDNIFVFVFIFSYFSIPPQHQYRVLFFGVLGAIVTRGLFIALGVALLERFHWMLFVFGAFVTFTGVQMFRHRDTQFEPEDNPVLRLVRRRLPTTDELHGEQFFVREAGRMVATPLFVVLVLIETTDVVFALDSIPAIFAVTRKPFIVFTSNVFAILGLRALYFLIAGMIGRMAYLRSGLAILLTLIGAKMIVGELVEVPIWITLGAVVVIIGGATVLSVLVPPAARPAAEVGVPDPLQVLTRPRRRRREEHAARRS